jgi:uncharacterized protein (TIGR04222 family)
MRVVPNDPDIPIPVAFSPPPIPVAEAGLLIDGQVDSQDTAATIIELAVKGALTVQSDGEHDFRVTLVDPSKASAPHETVLLTGLFDDEPPGAERDLSRPGSLASAHEQMQDSVRNQVAARGWFRKVPSVAAINGLGLTMIAFAVLAVLGVGFWIAWTRSLPRVLLLLIPLLPIIITVAVIRTKLKRGQRTAEGRAMCDQVEGFEATSRLLKQTSSNSKRARTSSRNICRGRSSSNWPSAGPRSAPTWSRCAGSRTRHRTGTSATIRWRRSTQPS